MPARLYVVSTPIGNLDDITLRALSTLKAVALVAAEDTRRTSTLLRHFGISTPTTSLHEHNEHQKLPQLLQKLVDGHDIALVSDAGTPVVADPGQRLIAAAIDRGVQVVPIPGPSAVLAALVASGLASDQFVFMGFAPSRSNDRKSWFTALQKEPKTIVFFEAPHRITKTLALLPELFGIRPIIIARELTKIHEEIIRTTAAEASSLKVTPRGEFTMIIGADVPTKKTTEIIDSKDISDFFYHLTNNNGLARRAALTLTAKNFGLSTKYIYRTLEDLKRGSPS